MNWYCEHLKGRHADVAKTCAHLDGDISDGAVLVTNGGQAGSWYFDEDIDTRSTTVCGWATVEAQSCSCENEKECPVFKARESEIKAFVSGVILKGYDYARNIERELYGYLMTKNNPFGRSMPMEIRDELHRDCADDAYKLLSKWVRENDPYGTAANNKRQPA